MGTKEVVLFLSTFVNKIDKKGRVSVPATFRTALSQESFQGFVLYRSYKYPCLECSGISRMERLSQSVDELDLFSQEQDNLTAAIFADAQQIPFDGDGRIIMPQSLLSFANIDDKVAFVGRGGTFQIWEPGAFEAAQEEARNLVRTGQISLKLRTDANGGQS